MPAVEQPRPRRIEALDFVAVGSLDRGLVDELLSRVSGRLSVPCRLLEAAPDFEVRRLRSRDQYDADQLLQALLERFDGERSVVVGLTELDLAVPVFTFVFGRALKGGHAAVVSLCRLRPEFQGLPADRALTARRGLAEVLHEVGHCAGLAHCTDSGCLMHFVGTPEAVDVRGVRFCKECGSALPLRPGADAPLSRWGAGG